VRWTDSRSIRATSADLLYLQDNDIVQTLHPRNRYPAPREPVLDYFRATRIGKISVCIRSTIINFDVCSRRHTTLNIRWRKMLQIKRDVVRATVC
jgi:hypothetical protein